MFLGYILGWFRAPGEAEKTRNNPIPQTWFDMKDGETHTQIVLKSISVDLSSPVDFGGPFRPAENVFVLFRAVFGFPWGPEGAQNVAQEHSSLGAKYRRNRPNGDPIGGHFSFQVPNAEDRNNYFKTAERRQVLGGRGETWRPCRRPAVLKVFFFRSSAFGT